MVFEILQIFGMKYECFAKRISFITQSTFDSQVHNEPYSERFLFISFQLLFTINKNEIFFSLNFLVIQPLTDKR